MDPFERPRDPLSTPAQHFSPNQIQTPFSTTIIPQTQAPPSEPTPNLDNNQIDVAFTKVPKRKRLAKACDACHKSKRRCDGTAPCSNCYFASKTCTYTDASGRPVPAPRPFKSDRLDPPQPDTRQPAYSNQLSDRFPTLHPPQLANSYPVTTFSSHATLDVGGYHEAVRKRFRSENAKQTLLADSSSADLAPATNMLVDRPAGLDHSLTRELVNLFFTHCNPTRTIIHKPSFSTALSHNLVPPYLLHAMCALAAPWSKQPRIRTTPARYAGRPFSQEALSKMFDTSGRLVCEPNLATAQALCLLQIHDFISKPSYSTRYQDIALQIVENLGVHKQDNPTLTPVPSPEFIQTSIERECVRRIFWLTHLVDLKSSIYFGTFLQPKDNELMLRLPVDETSFELAVHSTLPEYLYLPAPRTQYASEFGHLIRVFSIYSRVENTVNAFDEPDASSHPVNSLIDLEHTLDSWISSLPEHLKFSEENLQVQLSMFETSSNTGAWCFCCMHVLHASIALSLNVARQRCQRGLKTEPQWALSRVEMIISSLGSKARNSLIMGAALWSLIKYCKRDDPQIRTWSAEYEEVWGFSIQDLISKDWRHLRQHQIRTPDARATSPIAIPRSQHQDGGDSSFRSLSSSPSAYPSLGRSLGELRLHNRPSHFASTETETKLVSSDADIDPTLQGGSSMRNHVMAEGPQSLPSLKASGLLDSWSPGKDSSMGGIWTTGSHSRAEAQKQPLQHHSPSRGSAPPPSSSSQCVQYDPDPSRTATAGMPVGLQWLANESR